MKRKGISSESGTSILELFIVLTVAAILLTMAVTLMGSAKENLQRQNLSREFKVHLERARFDSVKRRPSSSSINDQSRVKITSATTYSLSIDLNQNGLIDSGETQPKTFPSFSTAKILLSSSSFPITIRFDWRGKATAYDSAEQPITMPNFVFCEGSCTVATATASNSDMVTISPTGTVSMTRGGDTIPTFTSPNVSNVNTGLGINPLVKVNGN